MKSKANTKKEKAGKWININNNEDLGSTKAFDCLSDSDSSGN